MVAALEGPMLMRKGKRDAICTTEYVVEGPAEGSPRRAGGQVRVKLQGKCCQTVL